MDSTITADRRRAHMRVSAAATAAFLALLLLGAFRASADPPQPTPAATPTVEPAQPPASEPDRGFDGRRGGGPPGGGGGLAPAPDSGGSLS